MLNANYATGNTQSETNIPNLRRGQTPYKYYLNYGIFKAGDVQLNPGPTESDCCLQQDSGVKTWSTRRVMFGCTPAVSIKQELRAFEAYGIHFMCSMCEGNESDNNDINNMDFNIFCGNDIFLNIDVNIYKQY